MNEKQYAVTKAQLSKLRAAWRAFDVDEVTDRLGSSVLARAEWACLEDEIRVLEGQVEEYDAENERGKGR